MVVNHSAIALLRAFQYVFQMARRQRQVYLWAAAFWEIKALNLKTSRMFRNRVLDWGSVKEANGESFPKLN